MTLKEFVTYLAGWNGKGKFATVKINNSFNVFYIDRNKPQYLPFYLVSKQKIEFTRFQ